MSTCTVDIGKGVKLNISRFIMEENHTFDEDFESLVKSSKGAINEALRRITDRDKQFMMTSAVMDRMEITDMLSSYKDWCRLAAQAAKFELGPCYGDDGGFTVHRIGPKDWGGETFEHFVGGDNEWVNWSDEMFSRVPDDKYMMVVGLAILGGKEIVKAVQFEVNGKRRATTDLTASCIGHEIPHIDFGEAYFLPPKMYFNLRLKINGKGLVHPQPIGFTFRRGWEE